jgi:hypothetical protein
VAQRREPGGAGEQRHVGPAGTEVEARWTLPGGRRRRAGSRRGRLRDARGRALARDEVPLGGQLRVRLHDHAARHPELARERARGGEGHAGAQPAGAHGLAELVLELGAERDAVAVEPEEELGNGAHRHPRTPTVDLVGLTRTNSTLGAPAGQLVLI